MPQIDPDIFRAYDIRGTVPDQINSSVIRRIAQGYASLFEQPGATTLVVGRDLRPSSEELSEAAIEGLASCGCHVIDIGQTPMPVVYFAIGIWGADGGLGITASHKPPEFNGMKVRWGDRPFYGEQLQKLRHAADRGSFPTSQGSIEQRDIWPQYFEIAKQQISADRSVKVVLDPGNGCGVFNGAELLRALGCELTVIFDEPDGTFPNRSPDPLLPENVTALSAKVREVGAELGIAIDADGDRIAVVDDQGEMIWPDRYVTPLCRDMLRGGPVTFVTEVRCTQALIDDVEALGGQVEMVACGYPFILKAMAELDSPMGFETTGHCYFGNPYIKFDDAAFAAASLVGCLSRHDQNIRQIVASLPTYYTAPEERFECADEIKFQVVEVVKDTYRGQLPMNEVDGARIQYPDGWALIRASNTGEELVMRWEGQTEEIMDRIGQELKGRVREAMAGLGG